MAYLDNWISLWSSDTNHWAHINMIIIFFYILCIYIYIYIYYFYTCILCSPSKYVHTCTRISTMHMHILKCTCTGRELHLAPASHRYTFLVGIGDSPKALMWIQSTPKPHPPPCLEVCLGRTQKLHINDNISACVCSHTSTCIHTHVYMYVRA